MHLLCNNFDWEIHVMIDACCSELLFSVKMIVLLRNKATVQRQTFINKENSRDQGYTSGPVKKKQAALYRKM